jgi:hypothetical protein
LKISLHEVTDSEINQSHQNMVNAGSAKTVQTHFRDKNMQKSSENKLLEDTQLKMVHSIGIFEIEN